MLRETGTGVCFSKVPRTFRNHFDISEALWSSDFFNEWRAISAICLFWKPDLLTCFHCEKNQDDCEVWRLNRTSALRRYEGNCDIRNRPEQIHDFWETGPRLLRLVQEHFPVWPDCACEDHVRDFLETLKPYGYFALAEKASLVPVGRARIMVGHS